MKKIFINIIVLDILLLILAGCQNSPKNETAQYASGNNNVEDNKKNIPKAKWQPQDLFKDKKEKKKNRKKIQRIADIIMPLCMMGNIILCPVI